MIKTLTVWWEGRQVGELAIDEHGDLAFAYAEAWLDRADAPAISVSLPKRVAAFGRRETRPFFAGLLPEEGQRAAVARNLGVSRTNDFRLLERLGGDVAGALTLWPEGETPPLAQGTAVARPLGEAGLVEVLEALPQRPLLAGEGGMRLSLAGVQAKLPVVLADGEIALPAEGQPTTHILKPPIPAYPHTTENEAFAMRLAAAMGLPVAAVSPRRVAGRPYLLVERYDRIGEGGAVRRLHQEDFCQALGLPPERKYAAEGGPVFAQCFELVRRACRVPAPEVIRLLDAALFNVLVGNADAHGKNYSLLYADTGLRMAPLYDLMCTAAYPKVHGKLAMKVGRRATLEEFRADTLDVFGEEIGVRGSFVRRRARELAGLAMAHAGPVAEAIVEEGFPSNFLAGLAGPGPRARRPGGRARRREWGGDLRARPSRLAADVGGRMLSCRRAAGGRGPRYRSSQARPRA